MQLKLATAAAGAWLILCSAAAIADVVLDVAEQALLGKRQVDAYAALAPLQMERAGDVRFDYLLGIAALDSGKPGEAIIALERVLTVDPAHAQARAELARAYFVLGDHAHARREFAAVKSQKIARRGAGNDPKIFGRDGGARAAHRSQRAGLCRTRRRSRQQHQ